MRPAKNYSGHRFGRLTALERIGRQPNGVAVWRCKCECGAQKEVTQSNLVSGNVRSCGCLVVDTFTTHGMTDSPEYRAWCHMKERCSNPRVHNYHRYGGRGIRVCDRWLNSFENFLADMGPRPSEMHSLEREDRDGNYEPGNCVWATKRAQALNRRTNRVVEFRGAKRPLTIWCAELGLDPKVVSTRLRRGWTVERALSQPTTLFKSLTQEEPETLFGEGF